MEEYFQYLLKFILVMAMEISSAKFSELTINDVSDLLLECLERSGEPYARALLKGKDRDGNVYDLVVCLMEGKR